MLYDGIIGVGSESMTTFANSSDTSDFANKGKSSTYHPLVEPISDSDE